jgi:hypothetical protein
MKLGPHSPDGVNNLSITGERRLADTYIRGTSPTGNPDLCSPLDVWFPRTA